MDIRIRVIKLTDVNIGTLLDGDKGTVNLIDDTIDLLAVLQVSTALQ